MRPGLVEAIVRGDRVTWAIVAALWLLTAIVVLVPRRAARPGPRAAALVTLAAASALVGQTIATALSIPRVVWKAASASALVVPSGDTWRRVRGPGVEVLVAGDPEIAVPTIDADGRWLLVGLFSGKALPGLVPASPARAELGDARLCDNGGEKCRAWPATWPDPAAPPALAELPWSREADGAAAYDPATLRYLRDDATVQRGGALELIGPVTGEIGDVREPTIVFVARRIVHGRLQAVRLVATPLGQGDGASFRLERADVSLVAPGVAYRYVARPLAWLAILALPASFLAWLLAPLVFGARLRRRLAVRRQLDRQLVLVPVTDAPPSQRGLPGEPSAWLRPELATVADDAAVGEHVLARGTVVAAALGAAGAPVSSIAWYELPAALAEPPDQPHPLGALIPADAIPFRRAARAWIAPLLHGVGVLAIGLAFAAPAIVAVASFASST